MAKKGNKNAAPGAVKARFQTEKFRAKRIAQFWSRVDKSRGPDSCWEWQGCRDGSHSVANGGYGQFRFNNTTLRAHRFAWELMVGPIPEGLIACHRCDNPPCCNPVHLFLGTDKDNIDDMHSKGRGNTGARNGMAKFSDEVIAELRAEPITKWGDKSRLAREYGMSTAHVGQILKGRNRRHG